MKPEESEESLNEDNLIHGCSVHFSSVGLRR
jgi:hypothetical protein